MPQSTSVLRRNGFTFKQFFVAHDRCAMKVGTDGILLGAWAPVAGVKRILDIGTGSGLLALMLAQRTDESVIVDAVELDSDAAVQAQENVADSPWADRVSVQAEDVQSWAERQTIKYDLIISNPPLLRAGCRVRDTAAGTGALYHHAGSFHAVSDGDRADYGRGVLVRRLAGKCRQYLYAAGGQYGLAFKATYRRCRNAGAIAASGVAGILPKEGGNASATGW
ncbi:methyltransferase [Citrobacter amalonaticus]|nr:methyltransferase [Citrobacter amalonaticus]